MVDVFKGSLFIVKNRTLYIITFDFHQNYCAVHYDSIDMINVQRFNWSYNVLVSKTVMRKVLLVEYVTNISTVK